MLGFVQSETEYKPLGDGGIAPHSSDERYIILTPDGNPRDFEKFCDALQISYKKLLGRYKGVEETSFIINSRNFDYILDSGYLAEQEAILFLTPMTASKVRKVNIIYLKDLKNNYYMGELKAVNGSDIKDHDYSYDPIDRIFYMIFDEKGNPVNG